MFLGHPIASASAAAAAAVLMFLLLPPATLVSGATLVPDEVEVLKEIAKTLGKSDWNFSVDPCSGEYNWRNKTAPKEFANAVICDCSFDNNTACHVINIELKSQSLPGRLPPELVRLRYLQEFDVVRNYLSGEIPPIWGTMKLVKLSLNSNRLSGRIPRELGNISTLEILNLDFNQFSGPIPPEFGNLSSIQILTLTSNYWTGKLPETLAKLTTLTTFRIKDSNFRGSIPNFIENWRNIEILVIQASGLRGPIPPSIASLTKLTDLRIGDLNGKETIPFPPLGGATKLKTLMLRSCNIVGLIPNYLASLTSLRVLDLSFNKLSGPIPSNFEALKNTSFIYLTGNNINGSIPDWIMNTGQNIDLSYNNFSVGDSGAPRCKEGNLNLFASASQRNSSLTFTCLENFSCPKEWNSLHINCGGSNLKVGDSIYEDDSKPGGPSKLYQSSTNWAFSSTGHFLDNYSNTDTYISTSSSRISGKDYELYADARLSPLSLTYYGFCMRNGNYTVRLHFAEIIFTNDRTYSSLGRRIFDIYIQGNLVKKDFNIKDEAGGANKAIIRKFPAQVTESTLEIRLYWAGKGTTEIPYKGVYGPLISAISVNPSY